MEKQIFIAICDRLEKEVPELRWIDAEEGQLSQSERPAISFPAALVDIAYADCETFAGGKQRVSVSVSLRIVFQPTGATNSKAPKSVRENALRTLDTLQSVHKALHMYACGKLFLPMRRKRVTPEKRTDGLKVYAMLYQMECVD